MKNIKLLLSKILRLYFFQNKYSSFDHHNKDWKIIYNNDYKNIKLNKDEPKRKKWIDFLFNHRHLKMADFLKKHKNNRYLAVDIGSGDGWLSAKLSKYFKKIIAIETSKEAIKLAKKRYKKHANIKWVHGFGEDCISKLQFKKPVLFTTCHVLSHLTNNQVVKICRIINSEITPKNSILNFSELYTKGDSIRKYIDTSRSIEWWNKNLPNWQLDFHGPKVSNNKKEKRYKGFWGYKVI